MNRTRSKQIARYTAKDTPAPHRRHVARQRRRFYSQANAKLRADIRAEMNHELSN